MISKLNIDLFIKNRFLFLNIFILIFITRAILVHFFPIITGDWATYSLVAKNILSGCGVSLSELGSAECLPHFGGNQGPGYPFFISMLWYIFGENENLIRYSQLFILSISFLYFIKIVNNFFEDKNFTILISIIFILSPLTMPWPRFLLTETLALAASTIFFALLMKSIINKKIEVLSIGLVMVISTFIRIDLLLLFPCLLSFFYIFENKYDTFIKLIKIFLIFAIFWSPWLLRNKLNNINVFPQQLTFADDNNNTYFPKGFYKWSSTWMTDEYQNQITFVNIIIKKYSDMKFTNDIYKSSNEKKKIAKLLENLSNFDDKNFPKDLDDEFLKIAEKKIEQNKFDYYVFKPAHRFKNLWFNFYSSFGWPFQMKHMSLEERINLVNDGFKITVLTLENNLFKIIGKVLVNLYKFSIIILFFYFFFKINNKELKKFNFFVIIFFLVKSIFCIYFNFISTRFTIYLFPLMEFVVFYGIYENYKLKKLIPIKNKF